ncbi:snRNA-activating protein complex subunit 3 [Marchantia polymorpha subsp. ruderalis]|uniref:snRNA-activating protein complex subunit n=3 Tax=Marchantia polymorpha TaxID=3197 RepID=A0A2R6X9E4_MARPO|nr:hypothetical protein MARPO_0028s0050 [Marchantia polymorpha]BBN00664.1 hypothetical protein Mp_2g01010 [Marchantia polymorpha subsp. ruderalis]|eukprot:PTQ42731.1 hypothetical protein MARPO_0028s0050 [Marchantia polymorpha]
MEDKSLDWMDEGFEEDVQIDQDGFPIFPIQEIASEVDSTVITSKDRGRAGAAGAAGGPLAVPGFTSGRINVHNFRQSCGALLSTLKAGLADCSMEVDDICVSVDDLKVMTDAMLVEKALAEVLQGQSIVPVGENPQEKSSEDNGIGKEHITLTLLSIEGAAVAAENGNGNHSEQVNVCSKPRKNERGKKRGRPFDRNVRGALLMDDTDERRKEALERLKRERERARESVSLHSLRAKKERESLYKKIQTPLRTLKFLNSILKTPKLASKTEFQPMVDGEVLITIEIYDSIKRYLKAQEFVVIGSQPLTALKDRIYCLTDTVAEKANINLPSSYFFIEDVFYNDMRHPKALDYSLPIRNWVREQAEVIEKWKALGGVDLRKRRWLGLPSCPRAKNPPTFLHNRMEDVCFADLECRIGAQFLYCHQGGCKHTMIIRDMRLAHPEDVQNAAAYPVLRYVHKLRHRKCSICCIYQARKVTVGDKLAPESPCFFCENCYYLLHYSNDGSLLYNDFEVHDYFHE